MKKRIVTFEMDILHPPSLKAAQKAEIAALKAMPDSAIDYSDIPPLDEGFLNMPCAIHS
jgi:hypothetical protein